MDFRKYIFSRGMPKTGQKTLYLAGDDETYQAGWWRKRFVDTNRTRFVSKTIGDDLVVFDKATGLMWAGDGTAAGCNGGAVITWADAIAYPAIFEFAGFNDWRIPNIVECLSILNFGTRNPAISEPPFEHTVNDFYWSSTTSIGATTKCLTTDYGNGYMSFKDKELLYYLRCVRLGV